MNGNYLKSGGGGVERRGVGGGDVNKKQNEGARPSSL